MTITKNFLELISEYTIKIPLIQRDYAQGRKSEQKKTEIFLETIILGCKSGLNLDFIYGSLYKDSKEFIPLDGQQRLTTLFLVHWYLSLDHQYLDCLKKFKYEVRTSSLDFLSSLTNKENWGKFKKQEIRKQIENCNWFFASWKNDPTIDSMLNMIELISKYFNDINIEDLNNIKFDILYLNEFDLTNELYVKMNARGKPLTNLENFKAQFSDCIIKIYSGDELKFNTYKAKFDNQWQDIFWQFAIKRQEINDENDKKQLPNLVDEVDNMFYKFIYNTTLNFLLEKASLFEERNEVNALIKLNLNAKEKANANRSIFDFYQLVFWNKDEIDKDKVICFIDLLTNFETEGMLENDEMFTKVINDIDLSMQDRTLWYSLMLGYINKLDPVNFKKWKRVTFNLINNQRIESQDDIVKAISSLKKIMGNLAFTDANIYNLLSSFGYENLSEIEFFTSQRNEELRKINLILNDSRWENELIKAEHHWYLGGQIKFLLDFSNDNFESFIIYRNKFLALWDFAKKRQNENDKSDQILIYQALLTKGNYLPMVGNNHTFCTFEAGSLRTKIDNWRKVFEKTPAFLQQLLDDSDFQICDIRKSLKEIIKNSKVSDFRALFINNSEYISYCLNLQIRYYNDNEVYLLKKYKMSGYHVELYTWDFFNKYLGKNIEKPNRKVWWRLENDRVFEPFKVTWYSISTSSHKPAIILSDLVYGANQYRLSITKVNNTYMFSIYAEENMDLDTEICRVLSEIGFENNSQYTKYINKKEDIIPEINEVCRALKKVVSTN